MKTTLIQAQKYWIRSVKSSSEFNDEKELCGVLRKQINKAPLHPYIQGKSLLIAPNHPYFWGGVAGFNFCFLLPFRFWTFRTLLEWSFLKRARKGAASTSQSTALNFSSEPRKSRMFFLRYMSTKISEKLPHCSAANNESTLGGTTSKLTVASGLVWSSGRIWNPSKWSPESQDSKTKTERSCQEKCPCQDG